MTDNFSLTRKHTFVFHTSSIVVHKSNAIELARANTICAQTLSYLIIIVTVHTCTMVTLYGIVPWPECGTDRSHPNYAFPDGFDIFHTPNHWANEETCLRFFENIIFPYIEKVRKEIGVPSQKAMVLMDNFSGQTTTSLLEKLEEKGIVVVMIPAGTTDRLQPLDVSTNKAAKDFMREKFRHWYAQEVEKQLHGGE